MTDLLARTQRHLRVVRPARHVEQHPVWCNAMSGCFGYHHSDPTPTPATGGGFQIQDTCAAFPVVDVHAAVEDGAACVRVVIKSPLVDDVPMSRDTIACELSSSAAQRLVSAVYNAICGVPSTWEVTDRSHGKAAGVAVAPVGDGNVTLSTTWSGYTLSCTFRPAEARRFADSVSASAALLDAPLAWIEAADPAIGGAR